MKGLAGGVVEVQGMQERSVIKFAQQIRKFGHDSWSYRLGAQGHCYISEVLWLWLMRKLPSHAFGDGPQTVAHVMCAEIRGCGEWRQ
jgi:hypothetical protein